MAGGQFTELVRCVQPLFESACAGALIRRRLMPWEWRVRAMLCSLHQALSAQAVVRFRLLIAASSNYSDRIAGFLH